MKPVDAAAIKSLVGLLKHEDDPTRQWAVRSLAHIGPKAKDLALEPLLSLRETEESKTVQGEIKQALKFIDPRRTFVN